MFDFAWPWFVLLLPLPWLVRSLAPQRGVSEIGEQGTPELLHPSISRLESAFVTMTPQASTTPFYHNLLAALLWAALVAVLMRPVWLEKHTEVVSAGYDLMIAVDTSRSMEALDFTVKGRRVNRMSVVKGVLGRFIAQRSGDRLGLIVFGDSAYLQSPLTLDSSAVRAMLDDVVSGMAGDATAMGDAVGLAVKKLRERPEGSRILILLTDGENTAGSLPPLEATRLAQKYKIRIYTVGVGSKGKVPFMEDGRMTMQDMQIDEELLQQIANMTGGAYFRATDTQALEEIYARIDALEKTQAETRSTLLPRPLFRWPLGVALVLLLVLGGLSLRRGMTSTPTRLL
ncbi:MAG: VWA domain-containing protein [Gammaproteobacteria bacterium]|nr:VWA domain-containing protein [Gammaproteobacteria bacterium]